MSTDALLLMANEETLSYEWWEEDSVKKNDLWSGGGDGADQMSWEISNMICEGRWEMNEKSGWSFFRNHSRQEMMILKEEKSKITIGGDDDQKSVWRRKREGYFT